MAQDWFHLKYQEGINWVLQKLCFGSATWLNEKPNCRLCAIYQWVRGEGQLCVPHHTTASSFLGEGRVASTAQILSTAQPDKAEENYSMKRFGHIMTQSPAVTLIFLNIKVELS